MFKLNHFFSLKKKSRMNHLYVSYSRSVGFLSLGRQTFWANNVCSNLGLDQSKKETYVDALT